MPSVLVKLNKATRIEGRHTPAGEVVEVDGKDPQTGRLRRDALYLVNRGMAELVEDDAAGGDGAGEGRKSRKAKD